MTISRTRIIGSNIKRLVQSAYWFVFLTLLSLCSARPLVGQAIERLSEQIAGGEFSYTVQKGDSLTGIGARFGVDAGVAFRHARSCKSDSSCASITATLRRISLATGSWLISPNVCFFTLEKAG